MTGARPGYGRDTVRIRPGYGRRNGFRRPVPPGPTDDDMTTQPLTGAAKRSRSWRRGLLLALAGLITLCLLSLAGLAWRNRGLPAAVTADVLSAEDRALVTEFQQLRAALGDAAWPGWGQADLPLILYNDSHAFLVGLPDPPDGWVKVPDGPRRGGPWERVNDAAPGASDYYRQALSPDGATPEAFTVLVGDRWVASMASRQTLEVGLMNQFRSSLPGPLAVVFPYRLVVAQFVRGGAGYLSLVAHESFHAFVGQRAPERLADAERATAGEASYPWENQALQADWQAELDLLAEALATPDAAATRRLATAFLARRDARRQAAQLSSSAIELELQREWSEGLARYLELEIWRLAAAEERQLAPGVDPDLVQYQTFSRRWSQEIDQLRRMAGDPGDGRFYYTGMAQAVLLDRLLPDWKNQALDEGVFLEDLLRLAAGPG